MWFEASSRLPGSSCIFVSPSLRYLDVAFSATCFCSVLHCCCYLISALYCIRTPAVFHLIVVLTTLLYCTVSPPDTRQSRPFSPHTHNMTSFPPPRNVASRRLNRARHITIPYLCVLSLATLILAAIYAYCVHQNNHHRAALLSGLPTQLDHGSSIQPQSTTSNSASPSSTSSALPAATASTTPTTAQQAILLMYSATLPLLTLLHTLVEGTLLKWAPATLTRTVRPSSTSSSSNIYLVKPRQQSKASLFTPYILLACSVLLCSGWIVNTAFWTHCELALTSTSICPAQVRNHLMYGIYELSIAKSAMGWALAAGYVVHIGVQLRWLRVIWRWEGLKQGLAGVEAGADGWDGDDEERICGRCASCECGSGSIIGGGSRSGSRLSCRSDLSGVEKEPEWHGDGCKKGFGVIKKDGKGVTVVSVSVVGCDKADVGSSGAAQYDQGRKHGEPKIVP